MVWGRPPQLPTGRRLFWRLRRRESGSEAVEDTVVRRCSWGVGIGTVRRGLETWCHLPFKVMLGLVKWRRCYM